MKYIVLYAILLNAIYLNGQNNNNGNIGYGLIVGVGDAEVNGKRYNSESTTGYQKSVKRIKKILRKEGFNIEGNNVTSLTNNPTKSEIVTALSRKLKRLRNDDFLVFYFFGHGDQINDQKPFDEDDKLDEVLVASNDFIIDDEINKVIASSNINARVLIIVDACNSGSSHTLLNMDFDNYRKERFYERIEENGKVGNVIYMGATTDTKKVKASSSGGYFTKMISRVWNSGKYKGDYRKFHKEIFRKADKNKFYPIIDTTSAKSFFIDQKPFKIK